MDTVWAIKRPDPFRNRAFCFRFHKAFTAFHHVSMVDSQVYRAVCNGFSCLALHHVSMMLLPTVFTLAITMVSPVFTSCFHDVIHSVCHCTSLKQLYFTACRKSALLGESLGHDLLVLHETFLPLYLRNLHPANFFMCSEFSEVESLPRFRVLDSRQARVFRVWPVSSRFF